MINKKNKKITNTELLESINRSFSKIEGKMATKEDIKNLEEKMNGKFEGVNKRIDDFVVTRVKYEDFNKLKTRVDALEEKIK